MTEYRWTNENYKDMSWHDNHVHGVRFVEGEYGLGKFILDIDYILEWIGSSDDKFKFKILPALLEFKEVSNLKITLDYAKPTAALGPFSIHAIEYAIETRERYQAQIWKININWPIGEIQFEANGFEQRGTGEPRISYGQWLNDDERK